MMCGKAYENSSCDGTYTSTKTQTYYTIIIPNLRAVIESRIEVYSDFKSKSHQFNQLFQEIFINPKPPRFTAYNVSDCICGLNQF